MYYQNYYKGFGIDLSRQKDKSIPLQITFVGKLEEYDSVTMFFIAEKQQKLISNNSLDPLIRSINCYRTI